MLFALHMNSQNFFVRELKIRKVKSLRDVKVRKVKNLRDEKVRKIRIVERLRNTNKCFADFENEFCRRETNF